MCQLKIRYETEQVERLTLLRAREYARQRRTDSPIEVRIIRTKRSPTEEIATHAPMAARADARQRAGPNCRPGGNAASDLVGVGAQRAHGRDPVQTDAEPRRDEHGPRQ